ncbi:MAG: HPP family protein [Pseudomonadales bacterium]
MAATDQAFALLRAGLGAGLGVGLVMELSQRAMVNAESAPAFVVAVGASAALVFAVPNSPFARPWAVIGGSVISALAGLSAVMLLGSTPWSAMTAVAFAIVMMQICRCLHPPGGAVALSVVLGGPGIHAAGIGYAFLTVGFNMLLLVAVGVAYNRLTDTIGAVLARRRRSDPPRRESDR